ncbi:MAG: putative metal-dependent hydrolase [Pyrinomonas methylaliphatogenes]|nr:putative metal-dependent hydrolase [Pyrinomonas methylaliphatogenes]
MMEDLRYPIGRFNFKDEVTAEQRLIFIDEIAETPRRLRLAVAGLSEEQLDTPYRPQGWTVRQVVHHLPDSHLNAYMRFKLALTEDEPVIKTFLEGSWAELEDARAAPIEISLSLLEALHMRWVMLLRSLGEADFARTFRHPEWGIVSLDKHLALYAWHGRHHIAQITSLRQRMGWRSACRCGSRDI